MPQKPKILRSRLFRLCAPKSPGRKTGASSGLRAAKALPGHLIQINVRGADRARLGFNGVGKDYMNTTQSIHAVEFLAHEAHVPIDDVAHLYGNELAKLEVGARIKSFLPIFALRNVRDILRDRTSVERSRA
jgi:hypothetical protein